MAKQLSYKKTTTETITVKGVVNETGATITYIDENKEPREIAVKTLFEKFALQDISLTLKLQTDEDLQLDSEE